MCQRSPLTRISTKSQCGAPAGVALADDPVLRWLFPDDDYEHLHQVLFGTIARRWLPTDSPWCTDDAVAIAGWMPPGRPEVETGDEPPRIEHPEVLLVGLPSFEHSTPCSQSTPGAILPPGETHGSPGQRDCTPLDPATDRVGADQ